MSGLGVVHTSIALALLASGVFIAAVGLAVVAALKAISRAVTNWRTDG